MPLEILLKPFPYPGSGFFSAIFEFVKRTGLLALDRISCQVGNKNPETFAKLATAEY